MQPITCGRGQDRESVVNIISYDILSTGALTPVSAPHLQATPPLRFTQPCRSTPEVYATINIAKQYYVLSIHPTSLRPLAGAPIWHTSQTLQIVPLYFAWYLAPSYGHAADALPWYIGVNDAAQISKSAN